jgi:hypothetical protein
MSGRIDLVEHEVRARLLRYSARADTAGTYRDRVEASRQAIPEFDGQDLVGPGPTRDLAIGFAS